MRNSPSEVHFHFVLGFLHLTIFAEQPPHHFVKTDTKKANHSACRDGGLALFQQGVV